MDSFIAVVRTLSRICGVISVLLLLAAVVAVCHLVIVRYVLVESAIWQHEFVTFSVIGATFIGSPYVLLTRGHVNVDLLPLYLGPRLRLALALVASLLSLAFCVVVGYVGFHLWLEALTKGWRADTVWGPPLWIPYLSIPLGLGLLSLQYLADILALLTGREAPFGIQAEEGANE
jgi:TRAP-type C4-dicarboxylate transport system permease small subunit